MSFPLVRLSRRLAASAFELRRRTVLSHIEGERIPNDESIVATTTAINDFSTINLKKRFPDEFKYWSTGHKFPVDDIQKNRPEPSIVHSGLENPDFLPHILNLWEKVKKGSERDLNRLLRSLVPASASTLRQMIKSIGKEIVNEYGNTHSNAQGETSR